MCRQDKRKSSTTCEKLSHLFRVASRIMLNPNDKYPATIVLEVGESVKLTTHLHFLSVKALELDKDPEFVKEIEKASPCG